MILYRPIGHRELEALYDLGMRAFPPRLPDQPIFYPVLNAGYAREIAEGWNTKSDTFAGYITRFSVENEYVARFERHVVGAARHEELWLPAEGLEEFNGHLVGHIEVIAAYFGDGFVGTLPARYAPAGTTNADQMLRALLATAKYNAADLMAAVYPNHKCVFCNYAYWKQRAATLAEFRSPEDAQAFVAHVARRFHSHFALPLPTDVEIFDFERDSLGLPQEASEPRR
jgi:hypothetical protein